MPFALQFQRIPVWAGHSLGLNRWVYCGASDRFQAAYLGSGRPTGPELMIPVNTESIIRADSFPSSLRMRKMNVQTPMEIMISVYQGHQTEAFMTQVPLASVLVERWYMAPGVRRVPITEDGLTATLFLPSGRTRGEFQVCRSEQHRPMTSEQVQRCSRSEMRR